VLQRHDVAVLRHGSQLVLGVEGLEHGPLLELFQRLEAPFLAVGINDLLEGGADQGQAHGHHVVAVERQGIIAPHRHVPEEGMLGPQRVFGEGPVGHEQGAVQPEGIDVDDQEVVADDEVLGAGAEDGAVAEEVAGAEADLAVGQRGQGQPFLEPLVDAGVEEVGGLIQSGDGVLPVLDVVEDARLAPAEAGQDQEQQADACQQQRHGRLHRIVPPLYKAGLGDSTGASPARTARRRSQVLVTQEQPGIDLLL